MAFNGDTYHANIAFKTSKTIDFEVGLPKDSSSILWYTTAEHIREDGLIVGRVAYQKPENRNLPIKVFTYKTGHPGKSTIQL